MVVPARVHASEADRVSSVRTRAGTASASAASSTTKTPYLEITGRTTLHGLRVAVLLEFEPGGATRPRVRRGAARTDQARVPATTWERRRAVVLPVVVVVDPPSAA